MYKCKEFHCSCGDTNHFGRIISWSCSGEEEPSYFIIVDHMKYLTFFKRIKAFFKYVFDEYDTVFIAELMLDRKTASELKKYLKRHLPKNIESDGPKSLLFKAYNCTLLSEDKDFLISFSSDDSESTAFSPIVLDISTSIETNCFKRVLKGIKYFILNKLPERYSSLEFGALTLLKIYETIDNCLISYDEHRKNK